MIQNHACSRGRTAGHLVCLLPRVILGSQSLVLSLISGPLDCWRCWIQVLEGFTHTPCVCMHEGLGKERRKRQKWESAFKNPGNNKAGGRDNWSVFRCWSPLAWTVSWATWAWLRWHSSWWHFRWYRDLRWLKGEADFGTGRSIVGQKSSVRMCSICGKITGQALWWLPRVKSGQVRAQSCWCLVGMHEWSAERHGERCHTECSGVPYLGEMFRCQMRQVLKMEGGAVWC